MKVEVVIAELKKKYPGKSIIKNDETNTTEILCEIEPTSEHPDYSKAIAVIDKNTPHIHYKTAETYKVIKGKLILHIEEEEIELNEGAEIHYLTSRREQEEIESVEKVLAMYKYPQGPLHHRKDGKDYKDVAEEILPDILIEDDCESIGGEKEMTYTYISPEMQKLIKLVAIPEFGGIDHLSDSVEQL